MYLFTVVRSCNVHIKTQPRSVFRHNNVSCMPLHYPVITVRQVPYPSHGFSGQELEEIDDDEIVLRKTKSLP
jgi:hypothetical protein